MFAEYNSVAQLKVIDLSIAQLFTYEIKIHIIIIHIIRCGLWFILSFCLFSTHTRRTNSISSVIIMINRNNQKLTNFTLEFALFVHITKALKCDFASLVQFQVNRNKLLDFINDFYAAIFSDQNYANFQSYFIIFSILHQQTHSIFLKIHKIRCSKRNFARCKKWLVNNLVAKVVFPQSWLFADNSTHRFGLPMKSGTISFY